MAKKRKITDVAKSIIRNRGRLKQEFEEKHTRVYRPTIGEMISESLLNGHEEVSTHDVKKNK